MRTPLGVGMNGGLSLRSPAAMLRCLKTITPEMVNEYRLLHGLTTVAYNPSRVRANLNIFYSSSFDVLTT